MGDVYVTRELVRGHLTCDRLLARLLAFLVATLGVRVVAGPVRSSVRPFAIGR